MGCWNKVLMAFAGLLLVCDEEGEKFALYSSVLHLQAGERHLCAFFFSVVCPQELQPRFHYKALGSSIGSGCSHLLHLILSILGSSGAAAPWKVLNFGKPERTWDETLGIQAVFLKKTPNLSLHLGFMSSERTKL